MSHNSGPAPKWFELRAQTDPCTPQDVLTLCTRDPGSPVPIAELADTLNIAVYATAIRYPSDIKCIHSIFGVLEGTHYAGVCHLTNHDAVTTRRHIAHGIGHIFRGTTGIPHLVRCEGDAETSPAHQFALGLLMPEDEVRQIIHIGIETQVGGARIITEVARRYEVPHRDAQLHVFNLLTRWFSDAKV